MGLGYGRGFAVNGRGSILDSGDPVLDKISDRMAVLYDMFYEDNEVEELLDEVNEAVDGYYDNLFDATMELLDLFLDYQEENE